MFVSHILFHLAFPFLHGQFLQKLDSSDLDFSFDWALFPCFFLSCYVLLWFAHLKRATTLAILYGLTLYRKRPSSLIRPARDSGYLQSFFLVCIIFHRLVSIIFQLKRLDLLVSVFFILLTQQTKQLNSLSIFSHLRPSASGYHQSVLCIYELHLFVLLFGVCVCVLDSRYKRDHRVFVFLCLTYFT